ncbi:hypothetical protein EV679_1703 [Kerstersia gyiorum]|uniref:Outer membrane protein beta-barrel domain-containing protein n=2 Tax=Kerstersia gyiorum TaxID=206506 RepID=A0A4Q7MRA2_9BURK|nr:hypothetical protein EV679_1703 [Kerstersia gyiorum]
MMVMKQKFKSRALLLGTILLAGTATAQADEGRQLRFDTAARPSWALQITPYLWAASLDGSVSPFRRSPTLTVDKPFSEIFDDLNFGGFIDVWGRRGDYVFSANLAYTDITDSRTSGPLPVLDGTQGVDGKADTRQFTASMKAGYRVHEGEREVLELVGGLRYWHISNDVNVRYGNISRSYGESFSWVDPVLGGRFRYRWNDRWQVQVQADIGGLGAGARFTWELLSVVSYNISEHFSASAGYKALGVDYRSGGHVFDTTMRGPVLGLTYRF